MKKIIQYLKEYLITVDKRILVLSVLFISVAIFINYHFSLNSFINHRPKYQQYIGWYLVFLIAFSFAYLLQAFLKPSGLFSNGRFLLLLLIAPALFSWKMVANPVFHFASGAATNAYWNQIFYWPLKLIVLAIVLWIIWKIMNDDKLSAFYGCTLKSFDARPYALMLLIMLPLIIGASTQHDFLAMYPRIKNIPFLDTPGQHGFYKVLYELSYGSDFITIELFFRGFLILAFAQWAGKEAIIPMACFYCTIHFGKPLGECISSYFGGIILGVVIYHTRTIFGGLMVHLGIAWMMEVGGYVGNMLQH